MNEQNPKVLKMGIKSSNKTSKSWGRCYFRPMEFKNWSRFKIFYGTRN